MVHQIRQITILRFKSIFLPLIFLFDKSFLLVKRAKGLNLKGKNGEGKMNWKMENYAWFSGTNDAFVTIALGKEKFQTTVKEKSTDPVEWSEQCELWVSEYLHLRDHSIISLSHWQNNPLSWQHSWHQPHSSSQKLSWSWRVSWPSQPPPARLWCVWAAKSQLVPTEM